MTRLFTRSLVRPEKDVAIFDHEFPCTWKSFNNNLSSLSVQSPLLRVGSRKFFHRSRHCLGLRLNPKAREIWFQVACEWSFLSPIRIRRWWKFRGAALGAHDPILGICFSPRVVLSLAPRPEGLRARLQDPRQDVGVQLAAGSRQVNCFHMINVMPFG